MNPTLIAPKLLGIWARYIRDAQHLSQEALAAQCLCRYPDSSAF